jgi:hypothetical protein
VPLALALTLADLAAQLDRDGGCWCTARALRQWLSRLDTAPSVLWADANATGLLTLPDHVAARRDEDHLWFLLRLSALARD